MKLFACLLIALFAPSASASAQELESAIAESLVKRIGLEELVKAPRLILNLIANYDLDAAEEEEVAIRVIVARSLYHLVEGQRDAAVELAESALQLDQDEMFLKWHLARCLAISQRFDEALIRCNAIYEEYPAARLTKATIHFQAGQLAIASEVIEPLLGKPSRDVLNMKANICMKSGDFEEAMEAALKGTDCDDGFIAVKPTQNWALAAGAALKLRKLERANRYIDIALWNGEVSKNVLYLGIVIKSQAGHTTEALNLGLLMESHANTEIGAKPELATIALSAEDHTLASRIVDLIEEIDPKFAAIDRIRKKIRKSASSQN